MKKFLLTSAAMFVLGVGVSMAQSNEATTETAPKTEKQCSKSGKKCCAAKMGASADAEAGKKDCAPTSASATEVKSIKMAAPAKSSNALPVE